MTRIVPKEAPISFSCDGQDGTCNRELVTPEHEFMAAFQYMLRRGWKAYKTEVGEWEHACPKCYVDWCRRAKVEPYETSNHVTYDEVKAEEGVEDDDTSLEPVWWLTQERERQIAAARVEKARQNGPGRKKRRRNRSRNAEKIAERRRLGYEVPIEEPFYDSDDAPFDDPYERSVMNLRHLRGPRRY